MPLTARQKTKVRELNEIAKLIGVDFWNAENSSDDNSVKNVLLELAKDKLIRSGVIYSYVLIDELL
jgi:hypothetical protein